MNVNREILFFGGPAHGMVQTMPDSALSIPCIIQQRDDVDICRAFSPAWIDVPMNWLQRLAATLFLIPRRVLKPSEHFKPREVRYRAVGLYRHPETWAVMTVDGKPLEGQDLADAAYYIDSRRLQPVERYPIR
jgi:hypothetical protein